jgi:hypothetical protein
MLSKPVGPMKSFSQQICCGLHLQKYDFFLVPHQIPAFIAGIPMLLAIKIKENS